MIWLKRVVGAVAVIVVFTALYALLSVALFARQDRICAGVKMAGVDLGGRSSLEAERFIRSWWVEKSRETIVLTALDTRLTVKPKDVGASIQVRKAVSEAMQFGRGGPILTRVKDVLTKDGAHKRVVPPITVNSETLMEALKGISQRIDRPYKDARLRVVAGRLSVEPEHSGIKINEERSAVRMAGALASGSRVIPLVVEEKLPEIRTEDARQIDTLLATFKTPFNPAKRDRTYNLRLAANAVNGIILKPGMEFSYNRTVGPRVISRGFRNAPIFVRGKLEPGVGGGICQVSSTIYNAVLLAGLKVTERNHHSRIVPYVGPGRDATVNYGLLDLRFVNNNSKPIALIAQLSGSWLRVDVYGSRDDARQVALVAGDIKYKPAGVKTVIDPTLEPGGRAVIDHGAPGVSVTIYRKFLGPNGKQNTEVVSRDYYPPQPKLVSVGPARHASIRPARTEDTSKGPDLRANTEAMGGTGRVPSPSDL